jgi:hypothetical protein
VPAVPIGLPPRALLEFDHVNPELKAFNIGQSLQYRRWQSVLDEIEKCEVVCRNCHRRRESRRSGAARVLLTEV